MRLRSISSGCRRALHARGCVKTPAFNLRVESDYRFRQSKTNNSNKYCREKVIEKMILCIRGLCTFSHSLAPKPTSRLPQRDANEPSITR